MPLERGIPNYWQWLLGHPIDSRLFQPETWGFLWGAMAICFLLLIVAPFIAFVITSFQYGPAEAFYYVARAMFSAVTEDLPRFSLRRTLAVARLAIQEAIRNKVLIGFAVFVVLLLFAGMFLDVKNSNPARVYLSFVLGTTNYLVLLMALFMSTFSIPNDIKNRTIYTVVTKPIRAGEIVLGRTLGFLAVGTVMLLAMGLISYGFVRAGLSHDHALAVADLTEVTLEDGKTKVRRGETSFDNHHRHVVEFGEGESKGRTNVVNGHWHEVEIVGDKVQIGPPKGDLIARAPVFGALVIHDRDGKVVPKGINVGNEWDYRGFIEGGPPGGNSKAAAIWTFEGVTPETYPNGLPIEMTLRVFRSYKGDIERGVLGEIVVINPDPAAPVKRSGPILFESKEYVADYRVIPRELNSETGSGSEGKIDLFNDLVTSDGKVSIEVRCVEPAQYFGVAQADLYLRPADSTFELNFAKAYLSIWLQMLLVTSLGVTLSTFLSGPVAMMATLSAVGVGFFGEFVRGVATGAVHGGGPIESAIRILTQTNVMTEMDDMNVIVFRVIQGMDGVLMRVLQAATYALPDFTRFDTVMFVADGYSIFPALVGQQVTMALVYFAVVTIVGYFCLKTREIAA
jgi:ABC-type transport system involved in multi-copper enzyme maturation permease subunit